MILMSLFNRNAGSGVILTIISPCFARPLKPHNDDVAAKNPYDQTTRWLKGPFPTLFMHSTLKKITVYHWIYDIVSFIFIVTCFESSSRVFYQNFEPFVLSP